MKYFFSLTFIFFFTSFSAQVDCPNTFDGNGDFHVTVNDLIDLLSVFGDYDLDQDGVWDSVDMCVDPEACNYDANPTEPCGFIDALGECGICQDDYMLTFSGGNTGTCCCTGGNSGNSYILADVSPNLSNASTATVEFWLHLDTYTQYGTILWSEGTGDSGLGVTNASDCGYDSNHRYKTSLFWGGADILSLSTASLGAWQHYALVFDNGTVSYFVDGVLQGTTSSSSSTTPNIPNDWLYFGGKLPWSNGNNQHQVNGSYRSIRVSSTARYSSNFTPEDTLLADSETMHLYSLDEGTGYTVYDSVDSTMTGTIVNGINANETWSLYDTCP